MQVSSPRHGITTHRSRTRARALVASSLVVALAVLAGSTASASVPAERAHHHRAKVHKVKVDPRLFGLHDANLTSLSRPSTRSIRLWDTGTRWDQMQSTSGPVSFTRLDQIVRDAWDNHTEVTFVAAMTPSWALADPTAPDGIHPANTYPPSATAYATFLRSVMARYKNYRGSGRPGIANYQVWNEANITTFWNGTPGQLAQLVRTAYGVRNATDPKVRLIAPAMVTRLRYQQKWISAFYRVKVAGTPVWKYVDAISLNLYPTDFVATKHGKRVSTPEDSMALLSSVRGRLAKDKVPASVPIWNTEVNYGMGRTATVAWISEARQVANVMRTYLLNAARGVKRVDWYAYDMGIQPGGGTLGNTLMTNPADQAAGTLTRAGVAFTRVQGWMKGTMVGTRTKQPCITDKHGTYTCLIKYRHGVGRVYWNPYHSAKVRLVKSAKKKINQYGTSKRARGGSKLKVTYMPVLVRSKK